MSVKNNANRFKRIAVYAVVVVLLAMAVAFCVTTVPAGYVAVQYSMNGGVKDKVLNQGWHFVSPMIHTTNYTVGLEQSYLTANDNGDSKKDESFEASSSEGKGMVIDLTFSYQYDPERVAEVFTRFKGQSGKEVRDSFIKPNIVAWTKEVVARYKVADIIGAQRSEVNRALNNYLGQKFNDYGIIITNVSLINIAVDEETTKAINAKITAQQNAETQAINNQTAIEKAEAEATVKRTQAQANAEAILIEANAQAEANKTISESLNDNILNKMYYEKWNGVLPTTVGADTSVIIK